MATNNSNIHKSTTTGSSLTSNNNATLSNITTATASTYPYYTLANGYITYSDSSNYTISNNITNIAENFFDSKFIKFLTEKEIDEILEKIISRINTGKKPTKFDNNYDINSFIKTLYNVRHFSEDFVLKYFEYMKNDISFLTSKYPEILTGEYPNLALLINCKD